MISKVQPRVLAYNMAKEITEEQIKEVSGGDSPGFSTRPTLVPSALAGSGLDVFVDLDAHW